MLQRLLTRTLSECLAQAPAPNSNCNSENVLRIATNSHRASLEHVMTVGFPLLHRIGGSMVEQREFKIHKRKAHIQIVIVKIETVHC